MTNKEALDFVNFWLRELMHVGHKDVAEKTKILKIIKREISMGISAGYTTPNDKYIESGMAKLMGERYPQMKIKSIEDFTVPSDITKNGLQEIKEYIDKNPMVVAYADYLHCAALLRFFSTRRVNIPISTIQKYVKMKSHIEIEDRKFVLKAYVHE